MSSYWRYRCTVAAGYLRRHRGPVTTLLGVAVGIAIGILVVPLLYGGTPPATTAVAPRIAVSAGPALAPAKHIPPVSLTIPAIGVSSSLVDLGLDVDGILDTPKDYAIAGWFAGGSAPGDTGAPAIIAGHVDSPTGPAVFYRLGDVSVGSEVTVVGLDAVVRHFITYQVTTYPKDAFPTGEVYAPTARPELRLITCTGDFDAAAARYLSNVVVYAYERGP